MKSVSKWSVSYLPVLMIALAFLIAFSPLVLTQSTVGSFEIDGNVVDSPSGEPIDWSLDAAGNIPNPALPNRTDYVDGSGQGDTIFGLGSKELEPGGWTCVTGSTPPKTDILKGSVAFRSIGSKRFMYVDFFRSGTGGDAHMDYEFSQSREPNPACPDVPKRTQGDVVITFDTDTGGKVINVRAFSWVGNATSGTFTELALGSKGLLWDAAVNIPNAIPGVGDGAFGEAVINLTDSPINLQCPEFAYMKTRSSTAITSDLKDRTAVQTVSFRDHPELANATGSAFGIFVSALGTSQTIASVSSSQHGVGSNRNEDRLLSVAVPPTDGSIARGDVLFVSSDSTITNAPAQATDNGVSEVANLNLLNGTITADAVRAEATTLASGAASSFSSTGSTFKNLKVNGVPVNNVIPNTRIDLPSSLFGSGSFVILYEREGSTVTPAPGQTSGGTYAANLRVNMIHVFATDIQPRVGGKQSAEIIVADAVAASDFPQTELCNVPPNQRVSGHAFVASADTVPSLVPTTVGFVDIPPNGGFDHQDLDSANIPGAVSVGASSSESSGSLAPTSSTASSFAQAAGVCLLSSPSGCGISATVVKSQSNSAANALGASSNANGTQLVGLVVLGTPVSGTPPPNTVIELPGVGFVILNEQFCDNQGTLVSNCSDGSILGHAGLTVRAIRLGVTAPNNPLGLQTGEVIVAEAHSDAFFR